MQHNEESRLLEEETMPPVEAVAPSAWSSFRVGIAALMATVASVALIVMSTSTTVSRSAHIGPADFSIKKETFTPVHAAGVPFKKSTNQSKSSLRNVEKSSANLERKLKPGEFIMSLAEKNANSNFNECSSEYEHGAFLKVAVEVGCISLFNNDISKYSISTVITFCGCETIGPKKYDFVALQNAGLISKKGAGLVSFIATGKDTSITLYNTPDFTGELHTVVGPETQVPCSRLRMGESTWDNAIYSMILQSWPSCDQEEIICSPKTTQAPVPNPTMSPFINPTPRPSDAPVIPPTIAPSVEPTPEPTKFPRARPTMEPLARPTKFPTMDPTKSPLAQPSRYPTNHPNPEPSFSPTLAPVNVDPTLMPTAAPSMDPRLVICKGKAADESKIVPGETYPNNGCASFFWASVSELDVSMVSTICSCGELGQMEVPEMLMADVGLVDPEGFPTISTVITGHNTSLTLYAPYYTNLGTPDEVKGVDKYVVGPHEVADLTSIERKSGSGVWNDKVHSISIMAWCECTQHLFEDSCIDF